MRIGGEASIIGVACVSGIILRTEESYSIMVKAIVGANWGDEGKGKITDLLAERSDVVIRFQGGANAGHTIINDYGRFALHILPSGTFYPHVTNVIGNGVALDIKKLVAELNDITAQGVPAPRLIVSERAQMLMPYHVLQDTYEESEDGYICFDYTGKQWFFTPTDTPEWTDASPALRSAHPDRLRRP